MECMHVVEAMATEGNPNSVTDAGVGALCIRTAVLGAAMNVRINTVDLEDRDFASKVTARVEELEAAAEAAEIRVREKVAALLKG
jgi:glutamate formiminotransferase/formiminotetrahydrofolate cyclodeaminase